MAFAKKLFFTALFLSILTEGSATTKDPWSGVSWYFHADLKSWLPATGIALNPFEMTAIIIFLAWALRGRRNRHFHFARGILFWPIVVFGGALIFSLLWGLVTGGDFTIALWELRGLGFAIIAYFLVGILFTHRRDLDVLTWVILVATVLMGLECIIRYQFLLPGHAVGDLDYDHDDSPLLAFAIILSAAMLLLGSTRRQKLFAIATLPIDMLGLMVTERRAGEAALVIGLVFLTVIFLRVNRSLFFKIVPIMALIFAIYLGAEWNCTHGALCQPARAITSQINPDPRDAASNIYRYIERQDILLNIQSQPITGLGFGEPYTFYIPLPDLSFWPFWHYMSHNAILWVWMKMGVFGFTAFWWLIACSLYRSGRLTQALSAAGDNDARALLAAAACLMVMQVAVSYVDLGLASDRAMLLFGIMLGVIGHLPGILRRSTRPGTAAPSTIPLDENIPRILERESPEEQVGLLAKALMISANPGSSPRHTQSGSRQNIHKEGDLRWRQNNRPALPPHTSRPRSDVSRPQRSYPPSETPQSRGEQPYERGQSTAQTPADSFFDDLPWMKTQRIDGE